MKVLIKLNRKIFNLAAKLKLKKLMILLILIKIQKNL
jgi:hypothetical protein